MRNSRFATARPDPYTKIHPSGYILGKTSPTLRPVKIGYVYKFRVERFLMFSITRLGRVTFDDRDNGFEYANGFSGEDPWVLIIRTDARLSI